MNSYARKINQLKIALGLEVKMAEAVLEDGVTKVEAESFEVGSKIYVVSESGDKGPAPEGEHTLMDGTKVVVDGNGVIAEVKLPEPPSGETVTEEMAEEVIEPVKTEDEIKAEYYAKFQEDVASIVKEKVADVIEEKMAKYKMEISDIIEEVVKDMVVVKEDLKSCMAKTEKMSKTPADKKISTFNTEAASDKFDVVEARIEALKNIRANKF